MPARPRIQACQEVRIPAPRHENARSPLHIFKSWTWRSVAVYLKIFILHFQIFVKMSLLSSKGRHKRENIVMGTLILTVACIVMLFTQADGKHDTFCLAHWKTYGP